ncbi:MAG TPA: phosphate acyltransferase PlsX [Candidatus Omnitrophota bacterium]|nr:phosphate acyltransferase PlsX [Candidatus Omnitrophota bacterium]HQL41031.1 phosphate acyltransferase PlsX [Candidatus Omnitrophota bacterium]
MNIIVDAMGGDHAPREIVDGAIQAVNEFNVNITFTGVEAKIRAELAKYDYPKEKIKIIHTDEVVDMHDPATTSIRKKKNSSISLGINLLKESTTYNAFISAGNTGAVVCAATFLLGMLPGVERPAIGLVIPTLNKFSFLIDVGANTDPKPEHLLQSAIMAKVYAQEVMGINDPRIGLLNIGAEESKGTDFVKDAHKLFLERLSNFAGNVEANEIFAGRCDCIICDGYVGNVVIKISESLMESALTLIRREVKKSPMSMLGAMLMRGCMRDIKKHADYTEYGGAPLLGVNGLVMISHGRSNAKAIKNAIRATIHEIENNVIDHIIQEVV